MTACGTPPPSQGIANGCCAGTSPRSSSRRCWSRRAAMNCLAMSTSRWTARCWKPPPDDPGNPTVNFHGQKRSNETHQSTTDPDSMLCRKGKGKEAKLGYAGHLLMENRNGLAVSACVTPATGTAERDAALDFAGEISGDGRVTLGGDKNYDTHDFVKDLRELEVTPHVAQNNTNRRSAIDGRTTRHGGYQISQQKRKRIEEIFGWLKSVGLLRKLRHRGTARVNWIFIFATAAYNLVRMRKLVTV